ncbi:SusC/RagA family TonB-linked outer membrane protein [Flavobacteriaceae bacterium]|nr:SusC/RagA family TonB-linked outer membrane protein [Flavobacteriaceae bacterium]
MKQLYYLMSLALCVQLAVAQSTVTGNVIDDQGVPLPGATVLEVGTSNGTTTDFDGNYSITVQDGASISASFVGYDTATVAVAGQDSINFSLQQGNELEEVIVTSLGIKREKRALGYAVSKVETASIEQRAEGDIGRVLTGKASGVQITNQSGLSGSGTSIVIRGFNSFSQGNQPLFVVDGVPFSTETNAQGSFVNGNNGSSRFLDIDPNNIEEVSVLKGLAAATLYGTQGRNGVILITTKSGSSAGGEPQKNEITINSSYFNVEFASMPDYQSQYGNGFDQAFGWFFSNWGPSFDEEGPAGWAGQNSINGTISGQPGFLRHPYTTASSATGIPQILGELGIAPDATYEWKAYDSVGNFFRTGHVFSNNVNIRGSSSDGSANYNINYGNLEDVGFTPGNSVNRNTLSFGGNARLSNKFNVGGTLNFTQTKFQTPPVAANYGSNVGGEGASVFANVFYTPRSVDLMGLPWENPKDGSSIYYRQNNSIQNPRWTVANAANIQNTNRVFGSTNISYGLTDNLNATYRYGIDVYSENNINYSNKGGKTGSTVNQNGIYETWNNTKSISNHNFNLNGDYDVDDFGITFNIGLESRSDTFDSNGTRSTGQQVYGVLRHFNFEQQDEIQYFERRNILGAFVQAEIDYNRWVYLNLAARKDWVSNLNPDNQSIVYPSVSASFLPTTLFPELKGDIVSLLKVRAGYGTSANFPTGYPVAATLNLDTQSFKSGGNFIISNTSGSVLGNPNLKPERIDEIEAGIEGRFFRSRMSLDFSIYSKNTNDLIIDRPLDPTTGYTSTQTNIGLIENRGVELDLSYDWIQNNDGLNWTTALNWSTNDAIVKDLGADTDIIVYSGFGTLGNAAIVGESLGTIIGSSVTRYNADIEDFRWTGGDKVVNNSGSYAETFTPSIIGDANPDWIANISNSVSYKNFSFNFLFNYQHGGDIFTYTVATLLGRGLSADTLDRELSFILPGVNTNGVTNSKQINNSTFYFSNVLYGPDEMLVYDASHWRLGEISLSYSLPKSLIENTPFGNISITASGFNLAYDAYNTPPGTNFDPNIAGVGVGNGRGFDYLNGPSAKRYGASVKLTF